MRAAAIDIGSNTVLMLVAETTGRGIEHLDDQIAFTRLGQGVDQTGRLNPEARARTLEALSQMGRRARELGADVIRAVGTSALRDAVDGAEFVREIASETGIPVEIISGEREAALSFAAATSQVGANTRVLIVDIGGNSTELIGGTGQQLAHCHSFNIGAVRLTERHMRSDPPKAAELAALSADISHELEGLGERAEFDVLLAIAGTATTLAAVEGGIDPYDSDAVHGTILTRADLARTLERFESMPNEARKQIPGLHPKRSDVIVAGGRILMGVLDAVGAGSFEVVDRGIRHALFLEIAAP